MPVPSAAPPVPLPAITYPTAVDWLDALGNVPLDRIVCDPMPGSATEADVVRWADAEPRRLVELLDGTLVEKAMGSEGGAIAAQVIYVLKGYVKPRKLGMVLAPMPCCACGPIVSVCRT